MVCVQSVLSVCVSRTPNRKKQNHPLYPSTSLYLLDMYVSKYMNGPHQKKNGVCVCLSFFLPFCTHNAHTLSTILLPQPFFPFSAPCAPTLMLLCGRRVFFLLLLLLPLVHTTLEDGHFFAHTHTHTHVRARFASVSTANYFYSLRATPSIRTRHRPTKKQCYTHSQEIKHARMACGRNETAEPV